MSCCGDRREAVSPIRRRARRPAPPGPPGEVRVAYLGRRSLEVRGTFSGRVYPFSPRQRVRWVDARDSRVLLRTRFFRPL